VKKIILIGSIPPPYHGSSVYFYNLLNSKINDVFEVEHLDISDHRNLDNLSKLDFTNVYLALKNLLALIILVLKFKPDLVYIPVASNFLPYLRDGMFILVSSFFCKAEIVIHLHEGNYFREVFYKNSSSIVKYFIKHSLSKVNTAIVFTENLKSNFKGLVKNIVAFHNGLKTEFTLLDDVCKKNTGDKIKINFLGNLFESKGVLDVLNAAVTVIKKNKNVEFNFAGAWSQKEADTKLKALKIIKDNQIENFVNFCGVISGKEKDNFLRHTDILVFPTWYPYEGCPMVIIEAMAYCCPVISTKDVGAIPEMVIDGETGILIDKKNPEQLADAIFKILNSSEIRLNMGKSGRIRFNNYYTHDVNTDNIINTFIKVIN